MKTACMIFAVLLSQLAQYDCGAAMCGYIDITYVECSEQRTIAADIQARSIVTNRATEIGAYQAQAGIVHARFQLPADAYTILISSGACHQTLVLQVLPSKTATLTAFGLHLTSLVGRPATLAGRLPFHVGEVRLVFSRVDGESADAAHREYTAQNEGDWYYAAQIPTGEATIRVFDSSARRWLDVAVVQVPRPANGVPPVVRDITLSDIQNARAQLQIRALPLPRRRP